MIRRFVFGLGGIGALALVVLLLLGDLRQILHHLGGIRPWVALGAVAAAASSYLCIGLSLASILRALDIRLPLGKVLKVGFLSTALNYVLSFGGLGGLGVRVALFHREGLDPGENAVASLLHVLLMNTVLMLFVMAGFGLPVVTGSVPLARALPYLALAGAGAASIAVTALGLFHPPVRDRLLRWGLGAYGRVAARLGRPPVTPAREAELLESIEATTRLILERPGRVAGAFLWVAADWSSALLCLALCFRSIGVAVPPTVLLAGFATGIFAGVAAFTPGGLGFVEGGMTAVFTSFGIPLEASLAAVLLNRFVYYALPMGLAVVWLGPRAARHLLRPAEGEG